MLFASEISFGYRLFFLLHILAVVVAFSPAFVWPILNRLRRVEGNARPQQVGTVEGSPIPATAPQGGALAAIFTPLVHGGAVVLAGLFGFAMIGMSDHDFKFSQSWVSIGMLLWFLMIAIMFAGLVPAQRAIRDGKAAAEQRLAMLYSGLHLLLLLQLVDMIWKPGH